MTSFLSPILAAPEKRFALRNARTNTLIADRLELALDSAARRRGLLGRTVLEPGTAMIIAPCGGIHTFFMQMVIDVVFASREGLVVKTCTRLPAWRIALAPRGFAAIEIPPGTIEAADIRQRDRLLVTPLD